MQHTHQGPRWWKPGGLPLLLGGLLVLEPQAPLSPGGHKVALLAMTLLMYGLVACWLRYNRGALINETYAREQAQECSRRARYQQRALVMSDDAPWEGASLSWSRHRHYIMRRP